MLIIDVKDESSLTAALRTYRRKFRSTKVMQELRNRRHFVKPSVKRRKEVLKAIYINQKEQE